MTSSNIEMSACREPTRGTTPPSPRMRRKRVTGESLRYTPEFEDSDELRDDRMTDDPTKTGEVNDGSVNIEWAFPVDGSPESDDLCSALFAEWDNRPFRDNDGVADSAISAVTAATQTVAVVAGPAFALGHLVLFTGFGEAANNAVRRCTASHATAPVFLGSGLVDEAAPPATARMKVIGFEGVAGDLRAVADGLTSEAGGLDLTTVGLAPGMFIKIGGNGAAYRFDTEANNAYVRVAAVAARKVTLDHLPTGWTADAGAGKTIRVFVPDLLKNGKTFVSQTIQRRFSAQATPTCIKQRGLVVNEYTLSLKAKDTGGGQKITGTVAYLGMGGSEDTTTLDASPDPVTTTRVCATGVNVGRVSEAGARLLAPNFVREVTFKVSNNLAGQGDITEMGPADIRYGDCDVTIDLVTAFGDNVLLGKFFGSTPTSLAVPIAKDNRAVYWHVPRMTYRSDGNPNAGSKNSEVLTKFGAKASKDVLTGALLILSRFEHVE